ncbi:MAG: hypothetical protein IKJ62_01610 [Alphaproteobacteria bacterium]|nr:hypothetical protein [Alphaproteobacteria bacterium]
MALIETLFDLLSASAGAILGALFAFFLNRNRRKQMTKQLIVSKSELEKIKLENEKLLEQIKEKENLILKMQVQILGDKANDKSKDKK